MNSTTTTAFTAGSTTEQAGLDLARELRRRWRAGVRVRAEELLLSRPELSARPEAAVELIYEEYCLREADGDASAEDDLLRRFPQWAAPLRLMLDCHRRVIESGHDRPQFPVVGERVGDFRLTAELARGSRGRVFLAAQPALADRPVVLKIAPLDGGDGAGEHLSLARLQHTHIVPLYAAFDDLGRGLRVLCMPYFGRSTLASLLEILAPVPPAARTGADVVRAVDAAQGPSQDVPTTPAADSPAPVVADSAARQMLAHVTYARAMTWVAACLADALQFAHERGVVHLDLKPSNVLLAADGQPMLLDFHLARDPVRPHSAPPDHFGGTPPYMPPEQLAAMRALRDGTQPECAVDGRADVYALGAMLYESLGGTLPATAMSPPLAKLNPRVSAGLSDVVAKCLAPAPEDRYPTAASLADDLRRHLTDRPLVGVRNRSVAERWSKWRRRRPGALRAAGLSLLAIAAVATLLAGAASDARGRRSRAELALADADRQVAAGRFAEAVQALDRASGAVEALPFADALRQRLRDRLGVARRLNLAAQLHRLADECRALYGAEALPAGRAAALASQCGAFWADRGAVLDAVGPAQDSELSADLQDVAIFAARLRASGGNGDESKRQALRLLEEAEVTFGGSAVIDFERRLLRPGIDAGDAPSGPGVAAPPSMQPAPRRAWDHYALGRAYLAAGDVPAAADELSKAVQLDPSGRWPNFYYGVCAARAGRHEDAVAAFSVCIGGAPDFAGCYYNRALAYAASGRPDRALADYDRALAIDPAHAAAALNRGVLHYRHARLDAAEADLRRAITHGADPAAAHYNLALVHLTRHDPAAATRDLTAALASNPRHPQARRMMETLSREPPP